MVSYTISYGYDELGRQINRAIDGTSNQSTTAYDALGRINSVANTLGNFGYDYTTATSHQIALTYLGSRTGLRTAYSYYPNSGDKRLQTINNFTPAGTTISRFDYAYNAVGNITTWTQQADNQTPKSYGLEYDAADQLTAAILKDTSSQAVLKTFVYGYDQAANRTSEQIDLGVTTAIPNKLNQIASTNVGGALRFSGTVNEAATVTVGGNPAQVTGNKFTGYTNVVSGVNTVTVAATSQGGQTTTNRYQVQIGTGTGQTLAYDANGNLTSDGAGKTYEWDAANRMVAINYANTSNRTEFTYDGVDRRVQTVEKSGGTIVSAKGFVWCANDPQPSEERDSNNTATKRFFPQGEQIVGTSYLSTHDHLGSIRELTDVVGTVSVRYDYDMYGRRTKVSGSVESNFGFTGDYFHQPTGLQLTLYRAYDASSGRWLSRDQIYNAEMLSEGPNIYDYVGNNPVVNIDTWGLQTTLQTPAGAAAIGGMVEAGLLTPEEAAILAGAALACKPGPKGDCTDEEHKQLQDDVNSKCKAPGGFRCKGNDDLATLKSKLQSAKDCLAAREAINNKCYKGGDPSHKEKANEAKTSISNCEELIRKKGGS